MSRRAAAGDSTMCPSAATWTSPIRSSGGVGSTRNQAARPAPRAARTGRHLNAVRLISKLPGAALGPGRRTAVEEASREPVAHSVAVLPEGRHLDYRLMVGQGDFRMAASSGIVFAEALLGRDGRVSAHPGAWYPEEVLSLNRVEASLRRAGIDVTKTDHDRVGSASVR